MFRDEKVLESRGLNRAGEVHVSVCSLSLETFVREERRPLIMGETGHVLPDARVTGSVCNYWEAILDIAVLGIYRACPDLRIAPRLSGYSTCLITQ